MKEGLEVTLDSQERIAVNPEVLGGKPIVRGTRISVEHVLELLASGWTSTQILESYPGLADEDIRACLAYAQRVLESERVYPLPAA